MIGKQATATSYPIEFHPVAGSLPGELRDDDPLYGEFGREYYPAVFGSRLQDCSFSVSAPSGGRALVECDVLDGVLGRFGMPIRVIVTDPQPGIRRALTRAAAKALAQIAADAAAEAAIVADPDSGELLSELGLACLAAGGQMRLRMHAVADLSLSEAQLYADLRRSAKPQVNWGRRSMQLSYCNAANPDRAIFDAYRALHRQAAGRITRGDASWDVMFDTVRRGRGELTAATLDGELVAGLLVVDGSQMCHYATAAYVRSRFDKPLAHWPLMDAIVRAKRRGLRRFEVGEVFFPASATPKEEAIGAFKKAFTSRVELRAHWRLPGPASSAPANVGATGAGAARGVEEGPPA
jgi:hypothetical protein